jgi:hypothetical protein
MSRLQLPTKFEPPPVLSEYARRILSLRPAGYWRLGEKTGRVAADATGRHAGAYHGGALLGQRGAIPNDPNTAVDFPGAAYVEIPAGGSFDIGGGGLTVEAWLRPDRLDFPGETSEPHVHWLGKGETGRMEWGFRFYTKASYRPNRISAYVWNAAGKEGAGAYFQEPVVAGQWIHVVAVYQPPGPGAGVQIYRNGVFKKGPPDPPTLYSSYDITITPGTAPVRLGTRNMTSFLIGALDEVVIYPRCLTGADILSNYRAAMTVPRPFPGRL